MASSSGVATVCASTVGFAPGYIARTVIVGGVTSGYSLTASVRTASNPPARMTSDITIAKIRRTMKKREKRTVLVRKETDYGAAGVVVGLSASMAEVVVAT